LLDYYRRKYKAYDIFGMVYSPVLVSIEWVKDTHVVGHEKVYLPGETVTTKIWVTNDFDRDFEGARLTWIVKGLDRETLASGADTLAVPADSSDVVANVSWPTAGRAPGVYRIEVELADGAGAELSHNYFEFRVRADS
jgi:hypothetical protein